VGPKPKIALVKQDQCMKGYGHKHINVNGLRMVIAMCTCDGIGYIIIHVIEFDKY